jgi:hypothetical protein
MRDFGTFFFEQRKHSNRVTGKSGSGHTCLMIASLVGTAGMPWGTIGRVAIACARALSSSSKRSISFSSSSVSRSDSCAQAIIGPQSGFSVQVSQRAVGRHRTRGNGPRPFVNWRAKSNIANAALAHPNPVRYLGSESRSTDACAFFPFRF